MKKKFAKKKKYKFIYDLEEFGFEEKIFVTTPEKDYNSHILHYPLYLHLRKKNTSYSSILTINFII